MMVPDPLRSTTDVGGGEDTSLALPSDKSLSSGHQRVLSQVHSIKRSKSKYKNGTIGPTQQSSKSYNEFGTSKFSAKSTYKRTNSAPSGGFNKGTVRSLTTKNTRGRYVSTKAEKQIMTTTLTQNLNGLQLSRSDPALDDVPHKLPAVSMKIKGQPIPSQNSLLGGRESRSVINRNFTENHTHTFPMSSGHSLIDGKSGSLKMTKLEQRSLVNSATNVSALTLKEAVEYLKEPDENLNHRGASFIQHTCFNEESAKSEVLSLGGIPPLVNMLESSNPDVAQVASGALRNLVFKNLENKISVQKYGGIAKVLNLLKRTESTETKRQVTGLLWNLSSADELKGELMRTALPSLTKNVVVPFVNLSESADCPNIDPSVFLGATGCLRNLSSGKEDRKTMRDTKNLIDSLMKHVLSCVAEDSPDEKSVENCMCTLHNLSYQVWAECPEISEKFMESRGAQSERETNPNAGCFSPRSRKAQNTLFSDSPQINSKPSGAEWLIDSKAVDGYVSLLRSSKNDATLVACCGALQNLTASKEEGSAALSEILYKKLESELLLPFLIQSPNKALRKTSFSLLDNLSRKPNLQSKMAKQALPELTKLFCRPDWKKETQPEIVATVASIINRLLLVESEVSKKVITKDLVLELIDMSEKGPDNEATTAASKLLYNLWSDKFLQTFTKKLKIDKARFVNFKTITAIKGSSYDVIESQQDK
ncbi:PREDICTED: plakophilin-1-like [Cyprinodon variegatus]|uniref:Plakophilin 1 n=1 Tax=Cyprinodon variegatus TaxID=28743 RepID=A0A3Q2E7U7_CYPVA|nr:PREDICTED: plakophilin-1-like [Cyprinodon variegatus]